MAACESARNGQEVAETKNGSDRHENSGSLHD